MRRYRTLTFANMCLHATIGVHSFFSQGVLGWFMGQYEVAECLVAAAADCILTMSDSLLSLSSDFFLLYSKRVLLAPACLMPLSSS